MGRRALVLVVALVLAAVAAFAIFQYLNNVEASVEAGQTQVPVFRAVQSIAEGTSGDLVLQGQDRLYKSDFELQKWLPADAITTEDQLKSVLAGKVAAGPISENAVLTSSQWVAETVQVKPLSDRIAEGKQAMTIDPGIIQGVNGFVKPGDQVNVIVSLDIAVNLLATNQQPNLGIPTTTTPGQQQQQEQTVPYSRFVLQGIPVLAVGQDIKPASDQPTTVTVPSNTSSDNGQGGTQTTETAPTSVYTLEVTPDQAERLVFALNNGTIYLTLVPKDFVEQPTKGVTIETLFEGNLVNDIFGG